MSQLISQATHTQKSPLTTDMWRGFIYKSHKSKHSWLTQPSGCMSGPIPLHHHITVGIRVGGGVEALWQTHTSMCTHTNTHTHLLVTTWLDQNKAFRQALFSAELIFLKGLRAMCWFQELFSQTGGPAFQNFYSCTPLWPISDIFFFESFWEDCTPFQPNPMTIFLSWTLSSFIKASAFILTICAYTLCLSSCPSGNQTTISGHWKALTWIFSFMKPTTQVIPRQLLGRLLQETPGLLADT